MTLLHRTFKARLLSRLLTSAFVLGAVALPMSLAGISLAPPAQAQAFDVGFDSFHDELARYGDWVYSDRWGTVWIPADVGRDFHPYYSDGRWEDTREYGWTWVSDTEWGDITYHYGRWVNDIDDGWIWVPGYVWSPGWVVWRGDDDYMGWMPMPPDDDFLRGDENVSFRFSFGGSTVDFNNYSDGYYGYTRWYGRDYDEDRFARNWVFIGASHIRDRDYRPYVVRQPQVRNVIHQTRNVTNYTVVNNYIVNHSADRPGGARVRGTQPATQPRPASEVMRRTNFVRTVDAGRQVERRAAQEAPHGNGAANSAPKPPAAMAAKLSDRARGAKAGGAGNGGRGSSHLYTRQTINNAPGNNAPATRIPAAAGGAPQPLLPQATPQATPQTPQTTDDNRGRGNRGRGANQTQQNQPQQNQPQQNQAQQNRGQQDQARQAQEKQAQEKQAQEKRAQEKQAQEKQAQEKQAQEKQAQEKQAQQQRANEQRANEQKASEQRANEQKAQQERAQQQKAQQEQAQQQRAQQEQQRAEQARTQQERAQRQRSPDQGDAIRAPNRPGRPPAAQAPAAQAPAAEAPAAQAPGNDNRGRGRRNQDDDKKDDKKDQN